MLLVLCALVSTLSSATPDAGTVPTPAVDSETRGLLLEGRHDAAAQRLEARLKQDPKHRAAAGLLAAMLVGVDDKRARELQSQLGPARPDPVIPPSKPVKAGTLAYVVTSRLRLREAARANARAEGWVAMGAPVRVVRLSGEWARVQVGRRTVKVVKGEGHLVHPARWSDTLDAGREGFLSLAFLDGEPPDFDAFMASARKARDAGEHDLAASYLLRAWALRPHDAAVREALVDTALAAERFSVAVLATRPPSVARVPSPAVATKEPDAEATEEEAPKAPYTVREVGLAFGCRGSLPLASLTPRKVGDGARAEQNSCAVDVEDQPECRPRDRRPDSSNDAKENARFEAQLAKQQRRYDEVVLPAFNKKVHVLRTQYPEGPYVRVLLTVSGEGSPPPLYLVEAKYDYDSCDMVGPLLNEDVDARPLRLPRLTEGESVHLWLSAEDPVNTLYGLAGGDTPEAVGQRLREVRFSNPFKEFLPGGEDVEPAMQAPGFWMLFAPVYDDCDSCKFI